MQLLINHNQHFLLIISLTTLLACTNNKPANKEIIKPETVKVNIPEPVVLISDSTNTLEKNIQTLQLQYTVWGCACANWITTADAIKYKDSGFSQHHIFIEPANDSLYNASADSTFDTAADKLIVTGQFYEKKDYPHPTYRMEEPISPAKVFRYFKIAKIKAQ